MELSAEGLKDSKKHKFKAKSVTQECKKLALKATEPCDVLTLARLFRYLACDPGKKSFGKGITDLLDSVGFEVPVPT